MELFSGSKTSCAVDLCGVVVYKYYYSSELWFIVIPNRTYYECFHYGTSAERCIGCLRSTSMRFYVNELAS